MCSTISARGPGPPNVGLYKPSTLDISVGGWMPGWMPRPKKNMTPMDVTGHDMFFFPKCFEKMDGMEIDR